MNNIWFISDTHFNHTNVIKYSDRPFTTVEEMNEFIIQQWNKKVKKYDIVWHLGDVALHTKPEELALIMNRLNGRKFLVKGNHDNWPHCAYMEVGFEKVFDYPVVWNGWVLSHRPSEFTPNVHGHTHNIPSVSPFINVSVEQIEYTPISATEIARRLKCA